MKNILSIIVTIALAGFIIVACQDKFNEQDFLKLQAKNTSKADSLALAARIAAINSAGKFISMTVQIMDDATPVSGVTVSLTNAPSAGTALASTATTDTNGFAVFKDVALAGNTLLISKTGYITASANVNFTQPTQGNNYIVDVKGNIVPIKLAVAVQLPIFAKNAANGNTATIKGKVTIETNLTNATPEIPQGITIRANLNGGAAGAQFISGTNNATITSYVFSSGDLGVAVVDNVTGLYSMTVPASAAGRAISLVVPVIDGTQTIGVNKLAGVSIAPQYRSVPTTWGPAVSNSGYNNIPVIPGAIATFSAPSPAGNGVKFTFATVVPRALETGTLTNPTLAPISFGENTLSNTYYQMSTRGSGYTSSPAITVTGGGATTQATLKASLAGVATGATVTTVGSGYTGVVTFTLRQFDGTTNNYVYDNGGNPVTFSKDVGVTPTALATSYTPPTAGAGFAPTNPFRTIIFTGSSAFNVASFNWQVTAGTGSGAVVAATVTTSVDRVQVSGGGAGYTSAPTIAFAAPGAGTTAAMTVAEFGTQWNIGIDNSANNPVYKVLPADVNMTFSSLINGIINNNSIIDQFGSFTGNIINALTVSGGNINFSDNFRTYKTSEFSPAAPTASVTLSDAIMAVASVNISSAASTFGQITGLAVFNSGAGFEVTPTVTITPTISAGAQLSPGSGGKIDLTGIAYSTATKQYSWFGGNSVTNPGSGYLPFINQYYTYYNLSPSANSIVPFTLGPNSSASVSVVNNLINVTVKTNDAQVIDFNYGTGLKKEVVN